MFHLWGISKSGDKWLAMHETLGAAMREARMLVEAKEEDWVKIQAFDGDPDWSYFSATAGECWRVSECRHARVNEDDVVQDGGYCPVCGSKWLQPASVQYYRAAAYDGVL